MRESASETLYDNVIAAHVGLVAFAVALLARAGKAGQQMAGMRNFK